MSIKDEIRNRYEEQLLFPVFPTVPSDVPIRKLFVTAEINALFEENKESGPEEVVRFSRLKADFDNFLSGEITLSFEPYKKPKNTFMALTDPVSDALWDIRSIDPSPAIRVIGGFAMQDVFVCLEWAYRNDLGGPDDRRWRNFIRRGKAKWNTLFHTYNRVGGSDINDYIEKSYTAA